MEGGEKHFEGGYGFGFGLGGRDCEGQTVNKDRFV